MTINKKYNIGMLQINARIEPGFVVLLTNIPNVTKGIYEAAKRNGDDVEWKERVQACIQHYKGKSEKEIEIIVDADVIKATKDAKNIFGAMRK